MTHGDHERIGPTAHYTAYVWRRLGLPHAELFSTATGAALYWSFFLAGEWVTRLPGRTPSMRQYLEYRHRLIDAVVGASQPDCLVELGAGLTRRGVTWAADHGVRAIEIDLPGLARAKREALAAAPSSLHARLADLHSVIDADVLAPGFSGALAAHVGNAARPVVVAEGLLSYFDAPDRERLFASVAAALARTGGTFVCDLHTAAAQAEVGVGASVLRFAIRAITRRKRALDPYPDSEAMLATLTDAGFGSARVVLASEFVADSPRLAHVDSPAHVVVATVAAVAAG